MSVANSERHDIEKVEQSPAATLVWQDINYVINSRKNKKDVKLLDNVSGSCQAGQMLAILGPSGAEIAASGSYVEQHDALLGTLTVDETLWYSARLSFPHLSKGEIRARVDDVLTGLGLVGVAANRIGTPIQRGISGGQKRRVTIGASLVSRQPILWLDEPTSGLDAATSFEVISAIRSLAIKHSLTIVATIHSPSWETICLFDKALLLAQGHVAYHGPVQGIEPWFASLGYPTAPYANPADHMLKLVSSDFSDNSADSSLHKCLAAWAATGQPHDPMRLSTESSGPSRHKAIVSVRQSGIGGSILRTWYLAERNVINYNRNLLAYGVRVGMYIGMGVLVATVWVKLPELDTRINDRLSVHFFSVAFLGFMSVAGIPSFLEEREVLLREKRNGLYGALPFVISNTAVTLPYLFVCSLLYAVIVYWSVGLHPGAGSFFRFTAYLFLGVYAAEAQSLLIAALVPIFVAALAVAAFVNGFWMAVQGYFVRYLPAFWHAWAHWIDYETYAFQLLVRNDFLGLSFGCATVDGECSCTFAAPDTNSCAVTGAQVVQTLGYSGDSDVLYAFILVIIIVVYRLGFWAILAARS